MPTFKCTFTVYVVAGDLQEAGDSLQEDLTEGGFDTEFVNADEWAITELKENE